MLGIAAYAAIAGSLFIALWRYPAVALAGVLCMFGLEQWGQATTTFFSQHQTATNFMIGGMLVLALVIQGVRKGISILAGYPAIGWLTLTLFIYAFASTQWAPRPDISLDLWASRWPYIFTVVLLSPLIITEIRDLRSAFTALLLIGGALTVLLLFFVKWDSRLIVLGNGLGNPLAVAGMAGMVAFIAILADPWPRSLIWLPAKWVLVALCLALVVRSGSRGQLLGVIFLSAVCWPISRQIRNSKQFIAWICLLLFFCGITTWALQEFWARQETYYAGGSRWSEQAMQGAMAGRLDQALYLVRIWYSSPETIVFGLGNSASYDPRILGIYPHFVPLEVLTEEGLIGFGIYGLILYSAMRSAFRSFRYSAEEPGKRLILGGLVGLCMFTLMLSFKQGSLLGNLEPFMLAIILGRYERISLQKNSIGEESNEFDGAPSYSNPMADGFQVSSSLDIKLYCKSE